MSWKVHKPPPVASENDNDYGVENAEYILYKSVDLIEDELGFTIKNRGLNVYEEYLDFEKDDGELILEEVDTDNGKYNFVVPVSYNGTDYTLVINVVYGDPSAILGISLR